MRENVLLHAWVCPVILIHPSVPAGNKGAWGNPKEQDQKERGCGCGQGLFVSGLCHMRQRIERDNQSRVYVHASVLWHIHTHMFCCIWRMRRQTSTVRRAPGMRTTKTTKSPKKTSRLGLGLLVTHTCERMLLHVWACPVDRVSMSCCTCEYVLLHV